LRVSEPAQAPPEVLPGADPAAKLFREIRNYSELVAAVRARHAALNVAHLRFDDIIGLSSGYFSKLVSPDPPKKRLGAMSLFDVLAGLGLRVVLFEDDEAMARIASRLIHRPPRFSKPRTPRKKRRPSRRILARRAARQARWQRIAGSASASPV
jgi:hypothetical protein